MDRPATSPMNVTDSSCVAFPPELASVVAEGWARQGQPLNVRIHADDQMISFQLEQLKRPLLEALHAYFGLGYEAWAVFDDVLAWRGRRWSDVGKMLDFACGYGRVTRFLVQTEARRGLHVSDILDDAVEFQRKTFGVQGFVSHYDPAMVQLPGPFDLITVVSLFTHLPDDLFRKWLAKLAHALSPGGMLVLTTQGPWCYEHNFGKPMASDFVFRPESESKRLEPKLYGVTYCSEQRFRAILAEVGDFHVSAVVPRGLNEHQDLYVIERGKRPAAPAAPPLRLRGIPRLEIDIARIGSNGGLESGGWALQGDGRPARDVELSFDGKHVIARFAPNALRHDLVQAFGTPASAPGGWIHRASSEALRDKGRWFLARATDDAGRCNVRFVAFPKDSPTAST
jgi:SAM-dependent methyltransferase